MFGASRPLWRPLCLDVYKRQQYISGLLFALPLTGGDCSIRVTGPLSSRGYVDMTLRTVRRFGITVLETARGFEIPGGQRYLSLIHI